MSLVACVTQTAPQIPAHTYTHIHTHAHIHAHIHAYMHTHTRIHTYAHLYIHTHIHTYIHSHARTQQVRPFYLKTLGALQADPSFTVFDTLATRVSTICDRNLGGKSNFKQSTENFVDFYCHAFEIEQRCIEYLWVYSALLRSGLQIVDKGAGVQS